MQMCRNYEIYSFKLPLRLVEESNGYQRNCLNKNLLLEKSRMRTLQDPLSKLR